MIGSKGLFSVMLSFSYFINVPLAQCRSYYPCIYVTIPLPVICAAANIITCCPTYYL